MDEVDSMLGDVEVDMLCNVRKIGLFDLLQDGSIRALVIYISKGCKRTCCRGMILRLLGVPSGCMEPRVCWCRELGGAESVH
jgi:hypothetical protein